MGKVVRSRASAYCVAPEDARHVLGGVHEEGLAGGLPGVKRERDGNEHRGDGGGASARRIAAEERVGALSGGVLERWHGALRARQVQRQDEENKQADGINSHIKRRAHPVYSTRGGGRNATS